MPGRLIGALACGSAIAMVLLPARASGGPGTGGAGGSGGSADGVITAGVVYETGGSAGGDGEGCTWERVDGEFGVPELGSATYPYTDERGITIHLWRKTCGAAYTWYILPETPPQDLLPGLLEQLRERSLPAPEPDFQLLDPVHDWAYVTVPLDFRAGGDAWRSVSVTASIGPVWATVTAEPTQLTFDPGDPNGPGAVSCAGDAPVAEYVAESPGVCSYTYRNASSTSLYDGYHFLTTMTIDWSISWTSSSGAGGVLDPYSTSASAPLAVAEVKGLVTCTGSRSEQGGC